MAQMLEDPILWVDCEMTGLDLEKDCLLEVAVLVTDAQLQVTAEGPCLVIHQSGKLFLSCRLTRLSLGLGPRQTTAKVSVGKMAPKKQTAHNFFF